MEKRPFWHPLPLWLVFVLFLIAVIVGNLIVVGLREGAGLKMIPSWVGGGLGGMLGVMLVSFVAKRKNQGP
ncbi:MAG: hypothetical protein IT381_27610 [Deltaproteobacteria bacterium]|nr:hypothetical protein [Deltaproteobacteria bacterium]